MEVTSAVHSIGSLNFQTRFSQLEKLNNNGTFFLSTRTTTTQNNSLLHGYLHPVNNLTTKNNGGYAINHSSNSKSVIIKSTSSPTSTETSESLSEVEKIKQNCLKWKWKGQYSINYFVSSDSDSPQPNHPPLLLVHGFGASIPHWRRYVLFLSSHPLIIFIYINTIIFVYHFSIFFV